MRKHLVLILFILSLAILFGKPDDVLAEDIIDSGSCGDNAMWTLTGTNTDMILTISGTGEMEDYYEETIPWVVNRSRIKKVVVEDGITRIGENAFYLCNSLTSVNIPTSITHISSYAFAYCSSLTSITIPDSVTEIGYFAFSGCSSLTSISIPDSVKSINDSAFSGCSSLTSIDIPSSVIEIGFHVFHGCTSLTSITIPDSVTEIEFQTFRGCSSLTSVIISDGVKRIGQDAFEGCSSLTSITIPDSVTEIGSSAFSGCSSLTSVSIPSSITRIDDYTFAYCSSLTSITIPSSVTDIGDAVFMHCNSLTSISIPSSIIRISDYTFDHCSSLTSITIPDSVTEIGSSAFAGCSRLTRVYIPDNVTSIGEYAFYLCSSLTSVNIPTSITRISDHTFENCRSLTSITIPDSVTEIGSSAFERCDKLKTMIVPKSVFNIGDNAFTNCMVQYKDQWFYYDSDGYKETTDSVPRIFGSDRYVTSYSLGINLNYRLGLAGGRFDAIILASGRNYPDALAGSYLSCILDAPILLVDSDPSVIWLMQQFIQDHLIEGGKIYILGGTAVVSEKAVEGLSGYDIRRLWGLDRYETNLAILKEAAKYTSSNEVIVCTGTDFADSLSAAALGKPIILVQNTLQNNQKKYLASMTGDKDIYIIGGTGAVSDKVKNELSAYGTTTRIGGKTRYETSANVAKQFFDNAPVGVLAYGQNFPDGLCGGALAYSMGGPLILTSNGNTKAAETYAKQAGMVYGAVLGGPSLISDTSAKKIFGCSSITW